MQELISIKTSKGGKQIVSARDLHDFLGAGSNMNTWFKNQAERCHTYNTQNRCVSERYSIHSEDVKKI